ncbi:uncharacterized protein LOC113237212 isoform X2 [Hyposmocoma kahamanoa]|uniref:uncharacterized protein LOC113237212 isoform X2 n=1 Tax=Hyposmocoma kahamanoa TaxID=1477025 RepID=UPI000E6D9BC1|nr:uncharacterized protein LOC113237212 isoform X2 [Hyposmocoma kahamanoa]
MASSDSIFLFEITLEDLKSYTTCTKLRIKCQFQDIFTVQLKNPNELYAESLISKKKGKRKKCRLGAASNYVVPCQAAMVVTNVESLVSLMRQYPIELILWSKDESCALGLSEIPWNPSFIKYLQHPDRIHLPSKSFKNKYDVFDEYTSRRMAVVTLNIKLTQLNDVPQKTLTSGVRSDVTNETMLSVENTGTIKTVYSGGKNNFSKYCNDKIVLIKEENPIPITPKEKKLKQEVTQLEKDTDKDDVSLQTCVTKRSGKAEKSIASLVRSQSDLDYNKHIVLRKSYSAIEIKERLNVLNHIFGELNAPMRGAPTRNQVYWVEYCTVEKGSAIEIKNSVKSLPSLSDVKITTSEGTSQSPKGYYKFKVCGSACKIEGVDKNPCFENICSTDLPLETARLINLRKCTNIVECNNKRERGSLLPEHKPIFLKMPEGKYAKVEEIEGTVEAKMKIDDDPCFCTCECRFGFVKRSTFCKICGGFEKVGEDMAEITTDPFPCPIYYNLDQKKKKVKDDSSTHIERSKKTKAAKDESVSEKGETKGKKKKIIDDRFKFNYGYKAPKIGHEFCGVLTCAGTMPNVPKHMGWLWTAPNVPGLKFRPTYRPGATNRKVVRMLNAAKNPDLLLARRRKKQDNKFKRPLKRPLLIVEKKDGEYTVTMETMKTFSKPRYPNNYPYEDKPLVTYTIGRTEEENRERAKKKAREQRRLERYQREFIQSAFRDMCKEICINTYRQALQLLPHSEDPPCSCFPALPGPDRIDLDHSCSCSDASKSSIGSATDDDEWIVEFTPPVAYFNPAFKGKKIVKVDNCSQYSYLDFRVKLVDRLGNPVPRFFKYIDGSTMCSDLGGFWSPDDKWLEINVDGFIGPDGRWAPNVFTGPNGEQVENEDGKFQAANNEWLEIGVDGYVDCQGKWRFYPRARGGGQGRRGGEAVAAKNGKKNKGKKYVAEDKRAPKETSKPSEASWSCFGDASPKDISGLGIKGHGHDRLLISKFGKMDVQGDHTNIPHVIPRSNFKRKHGRGADRTSDDSVRYKCKHPKSSGKGIVAVDERGNKTFFRLKEYQNPRPKDRLVTLDKEGFSLSSFHVPCFSSFINGEVMRQQQIEHILRHNERVLKTASTQVC